ncbi:MAG: DEAD/DEAH box helicase [Bifidobacteriaceae bacterium]|nr:DEAD/DEAH box helicase [Bifidobacteriaceae bacterium]
MTEPKTIALEHALAAVRAENQRLRNLLRLTDGAEPPPQQAALALVHPGALDSRSPLQAKIALFGSLFASRPDAFARRWDNGRKPKSGWGPAAARWYPKGTKLEDKELLPLTPAILERHLRGEMYIGLYPVLVDDTCWWLAADFDGASAMLDAHAYAKAAASLGIPTALEISHSGKGVHVWIFFSEPVPAARARALGEGCLHLAHGIRGALPLGSYDRLFPNQDTVPRGGLGNLIAAPLHGLSRKRGTTVFVDPVVWEPHKDQWEFLSVLDRVTPGQLAAAVKAAPVIVGEDVKAFRPSRATAIQPLPPAHVHATLGRGLIIAAEDLPRGLAAILRNAATMRNPMFYKKQTMRLPTYGTPRFLQGFDLSVEGDVILPRGLTERAAQLVKQAGSELVVKDERQRGAEIDVAFSGDLTTVQAAAVDAVLAHEAGILQAPTGAGKTVMACAIIAERGVNTLIMVDRKILADQWRERIQAFLGVKPGQMGGGRKKTTGVVDIVMLQSLARRTEEEVAAFGEPYGQVIVDECHHLAAGSYEHSVSRIGATWWLGLTATPERADGLEQLVTWQLGPIRHAVRDILPADDSLTTPYLGPERRLVIHQTAFRAATAYDPADPASLAAVYRELAADAVRNDQIATDVLAAVGEGRKCLVVTKLRDHVDALAGRVRAAGHDPVILRGGLGAKELADARKRLAAHPADLPLVAIGTLPYIGEGFDAPVLDTVFLTAPISFPGRLVQAIGRIRMGGGKTAVTVHDYTDPAVPLLAAQFRRRQPGYRQLGFTEWTR